MEMGLGVPVFLGQSKINHVDLIATLANAHQKVVRLDVTVDERLCMNVLDTGDQLVGQQKHGLQGEFAVAEVEKILKTRAEEIENHGVVVTFSTEPTDKRDAHTSSERLVDTSFILELGVLGFNTLKLDRNLLTGDDVGAWKMVSIKAVNHHTDAHTKVDITKATTANLTTDPIFIPHTEILEYTSQQRYRTVD